MGHPPGDGRPQAAYWLTSQRAPPPMVFSSHIFLFYFLPLALLLYLSLIHI